MLRSQATRLSGRNLFPRLFGPPAEAGHKNAIFHFDQIWIHSIKNQRMRFAPGLAFIVGLGLVEGVGPFCLVTSGPQENDEMRPHAAHRSLIDLHIALIEPGLRRIERRAPVTYEVLGTRQHGERIPERLWISLVALARVHGVSPVAQALRLDYYGLKRRVLESEPPRKPRRKTIAPFVELPLIGPTPISPRCTVELAQYTGATLTIRWEGQAAVDVMELAESFWRAGR